MLVLTATSIRSQNIAIDKYWACDDDDKMLLSLNAPLNCRSLMAILTTAANIIVHMVATSCVFGGNGSLDRANAITVESPLITICVDVLYSCAWSCHGFFVSPTASREIVFVNVQRRFMYGLWDKRIDSWPPKTTTGIIYVPCMPWLLLYMYVDPHTVVLAATTPAVVAVYLVTWIH